MNTEQQRGSFWKGGALRYVMFAVILLVVLLLAWTSDDAYHGYVMSRNLAKGNGLVYNIGERVNASTIPFFTILLGLAYMVYPNMYLVGMLVNVVTSMAAVAVVLWGVCKNNKQVLFSSAALVFCVAFITYTTSGLENSMLYLLSALIVYCIFHYEEFGYRQLLGLAVLMALLAGTRMDSVLIFLPVGLYVFCFKKKKTIPLWKSILTGVVGILPFLAWIVFSFIYYGFPFPNTYYAKVTTGYPLSSYLYNGVSYFLTSLITDPLLLVLPLCYMVLSVVLLVRKGVKSHFLMAMGGLLYWGYLLYIGGDFMMGRHFTVVYLVSVCGIMLIMPCFAERFAWKSQRVLAAALAVCVLWTTQITPFAGKTYTYFGNSMWGNMLNCAGVADEREFYAPYTSLVSYLLNGEDIVIQRWLGNVPRQAVDSWVGWAPGILVYYAYENAYVTDPYALGDAFLTRVPAATNGNWFRTGHVARITPEGYIETVATGENCLVDEEYRKLYDDIQLITRGELFSKERIEKIIEYNFKK